MSTAARAPEVPLRVITPALVRESVQNARRNLREAADEIIWQIAMETWRTLGYKSWDEMREAEYGGAAFMVPRKDRQELVGRMRELGLTQEQIAGTAGVARSTVASDILNADSDIEKITNSRGQQRPATHNRTPRGEDVVDAEIIDDTPPQSPAPDKAPDAARDAETTPTTVRAETTATCATCGGTGKVTT